MVLTQLWLPILAAAIAVFIASSLIHMVFKWHNADYRALPNEDDVRRTLSTANLSAGYYVTPHCPDMKDMGSDAMQQKFRDGPVALITLRAPGTPNMGKYLGLWFLLNLAISASGAMLVVQAFGIAGNAHQAGHFIGIFSLIVYACGSVQDAIWMGKPWSVTLKDVLDAFIYGSVSALSFWLLWP